MFDQNLFTTFQKPFFTVISTKPTLPPTHKPRGQLLFWGFYTGFQDFRDFKDFRTDARNFRHFKDLRPDIRVFKD